MCVCVSVCVNALSFVLLRNFHLHLTPQQGLFSDDFVAYHVDRHGNMTLYKVDKNRFYSGHALGEFLITLPVWLI